MNYNLDEWKDYILNILIEEGDASLTDYIWELLIKKFSLGKNEKKEYYLYTECALKSLEVEFNLIRRSGSRGIQITEKGRYVAHKGFRSFINSTRRHEMLSKINDYLGTISGLLSIISALFSFVNIYYGWINKIEPLISTFLLIIIAVVFKFLFNSRNNKFTSIN